MFAMIWPIALVVLSNIVYHICTKSVPNQVHPFAVLTVTYLVGALCSTVFYFVMSGRRELAAEIAEMNWAPYILGIVIVGLEVGFIYAYRAGCQVSSASIVESSVLGTALILVGKFIYHEPLTWNRILGIVICMVGLAFINLK